MSDKDRKGRFVKGNRFQVEHGNQLARKTSKAMQRELSKVNLALHDPNRDERGRFVKGHKYRFEAGNQASRGWGAPFGNQNAKGHGAPLDNTNASGDGWKTWERRTQASNIRSLCYLSDMRIFYRDYVKRVELARFLRHVRSRCLYWKIVKDCNLFVKLERLGVSLSQYEKEDTINQVRPEKRLRTIWREYDRHFERWKKRHPHSPLERTDIRLFLWAEYHGSIVEYPLCSFADEWRRGLSDVLRAMRK